MIIFLRSIPGICNNCLHDCPQCQRKRRHNLRSVTLRLIQRLTSDFPPAVPPIEFVKTVDVTNNYSFHHRFGVNTSCTNYARIGEKKNKQTFNTFNRTIIIKALFPLGSACSSPLKKLLLNSKFNKILVRKVT